jgi:hypothetical protein
MVECSPYSTPPEKCVLVFFMRFLFVNTNINVAKKIRSLLEFVKQGKALLKKPVRINHIV